MSDIPPFQPPQSSQPPEPYQPPAADPGYNDPIQIIKAKNVRRGSLILVAIAWVVILAIGSLVYLAHYMSSQEEPTEGEAKVELQQVNSLAKSAIAATNWWGDDSGQAESLNTGPLEHRLCYVLVQSELEGPQIALESLEDLDKLVVRLKYDRNDSQVRLTQIIDSMLNDYANDDWAASSLADSDRTFLKEQLGFSAEMSLAPSETKNIAERDALIDQAQRSTILLWMIMGIVVVGAIIGLFCFLGLCIMLGLKIFTNTGPLRIHFVSDTLHGRIYAETFAVWIVCFVGMGLAIGLAIGLSGLDLSEVGSASIGLFAFFGSLIALLWPVLRGIPFSEVREDIGLTWGSNPIKEVFLGIFAYLANLPIMFVGLMFATGLTLWSESMQDKHELEATRQASHPIVEQIAAGDVLLISLVILTACVAAPIVEEIVFRGVLYRHLRELSLKLSYVGSVIFSILLNSFIFAAIHPQGWTAIPVLMSLAIGFTWAREWRSSLIASMTMHALNNGMITLVMLSFLF